MQRNTFFRILLAAGVILIPTTLTLFFVYVYEGASLRDFIPHYFPLDDLYYWRQIYTFSDVGFDGGYIVYDEQPAAAGWSHFGAHGPLFPLIYGIPASITGWYAYSPPIFNLVVLSIGLIAVIAALRLDTRQLTAAGFLIATSWPVHFYVLSCMQESLQQTIAMVFAILFTITITRRDGVSRQFKIGFVLFLLFAALLRMTWVFLALPFFVLTMPRITPRRVALAAIKTLGLFLIVFVLTGGYLYAPYEDNFVSAWQTGVVDAWSDDGPRAALDTGIDLLGENIEDNVAFLNRGIRLEVSQRYQILFLIAVLSVWLAARWRAHRQPDITTWAVGFGAYNLVYIFAINMVLYTMAGWRDYRVMAPHLLLTGLLMVALSRFRWVALIVAVNLATVIPFKNYYLAFGSAFLSHDQASITRFEDATKDILVYDPDEANPWCNTLLMEWHSSYKPPVIAVPAGIGISIFTITDTLDLPLKSRYVILFPRHYAELSERSKLQHVAETEIGDLYLNLDANCHGESSE